MIGPWSEWWIEGSKVVLIGPGTVVLSGNNSCNGVFQLEGRPTYPQQNSFSVSLSLGIFLFALNTISCRIFARSSLTALPFNCSPSSLSPCAAFCPQCWFCTALPFLSRYLHPSSAFPCAIHPLPLCFCPFKFASLFQLSLAGGLALRRPVERSGRYEEALQQQRDQRWC